MERTPDGTPVGVDDPYEVAGVCDHLTDDGRCRYALAYAGNDPAFAAERRRDDYTCHVGEDGCWTACPHYRSTTDGSECVRCGLEEVRLAHEDARPLLEEHHLMYGDADAEPSVEGGDRAGDGGDRAGDGGDDSAVPADADTGDSAAPADADTGDSAAPADADADDAGPHEITVSLCRWCHTKVHKSFARIDDDASPDPEAIAEREGRRSKEQEELGFSAASERFGDE